MSENRPPAVLLGCDHAAFPLKERLKTHLEKRGLPVIDVGTGSEASVDYPVFAAKVAAPISSGEARRGILLCGTGIGMSMAANRFPRVRAALCNDLFSAVMSRRHNDANLLVLGGRVLGETLAEAVVDAWLDTPFEGGRHQKRLELFDTLERLIDSAEG
jgi:ribose 5-phosphate isomerase B